jgi:hypothetical protein
MQHMFAQAKIGKDKTTGEKRLQEMQNARANKLAAHANEIAELRQNLNDETEREPMSDAFLVAWLAMVGSMPANKGEK